MPLYDFRCRTCESEDEYYIRFDSVAPECCESVMQRIFPLVADYTTGTNRSARQRWCRDWTPDSKPFKVVSVHGEKT